MNRSNCFKAPFVTPSTVLILSTALLLQAMLLQAVPLSAPPTTSVPPPWPRALDRNDAGSRERGDQLEQNRNSGGALGSGRGSGGRQGPAPSVTEITERAPRFVAVEA
jgi:hypothetical protein